MSAPATIRAASQADTAALLHLWTALADTTGPSSGIRPPRCPGPSGETLRALPAAVWATPERQAIRIAEEGGEGVRAVGFVRLRLDDDGPCAGRIETLGVARAARARRIGARRLEMACAWCRDRGAAAVAVDFVATNALVDGFYAHEGFQPLLATDVRRLGNPTSKNG